MNPIGKRKISISRKGYHVNVVCTIVHRISKTMPMLEVIVILVSVSSFRSKLSMAP